MIVIPVIDVSGGRCVHAVAGKRSAYEPLVSNIAAGDCPLEVGSTLSAKLAPQALYVADLDGLTLGEVQWSCLESLAGLPCDVWFDVGARQTNCDELAAFMSLRSNVHCILATETMDSADLLPRMVDRNGTDRLVVSIDLQDGKLVAAYPEYQELTPERLIAQFATAGVSRFVLLDVAAVGTDTGCPTLPLVAAIKRDHPELMIATGGGIRDTTDLTRLADAGCDAALVGTAIHRGQINSAVWPPSNPGEPAA